jgi:hypothetical protein
MYLLLTFTGRAAETLVGAARFMRRTRQSAHH